MTNYLPLAKNEEVKFWISNNLRNYLSKDQVMENQSEIEHIIDFLHSDKAPKRLKKMSYSEALEGSKKWLKTMIKKGSNIDDVEGIDYEVVIDFNDGFKLVKLLTKSAYSREGALMAHCVQSYFDTNSGNIYSLRDSRNMPHCTLELPEDGEEFNQCKGKGNGPIHPKYIDYILKTMENFGIEMRDSEMSNLGYFRPEGSGAKNNQIEWFKSSFKNLKKIEVKEKIYYSVQ